MESVAKISFIGRQMLKIDEVTTDILLSMGKSPTTESTNDIKS
jgi:hypothetical protein